MLFSEVSVMLVMERRRAVTFLGPTDCDATWVDALATQQRWQMEWLPLIVDRIESESYSSNGTVRQNLIACILIACCTLM